eukprot:GHVS01005060.1.p1 GENE.GHVS01005060.1~~GHVS01005060.1.p1  ORF type:complete len:388 (-),score=59.42 GHVS01005060.1:317-1480(-)
MVAFHLFVLVCYSFLLRTEQTGISKQDLLIIIRRWPVVTNEGVVASEGAVDCFKKWLATSAVDGSWNWKHHKLIVNPTTKSKKEEKPTSKSKIVIGLVGMSKLSAPSPTDAKPTARSVTVVDLRATCTTQVDSTLYHLRVKGEGEVLCETPKIHYVSETRINLKLPYSSAYKEVAFTKETVHKAGRSSATAGRWCIGQITTVRQPVKRAEWCLKRAKPQPKVDIQLNRYTKLPKREEKSTDQKSMDVSQRPVEVNFPDGEKAAPDQKAKNREDNPSRSELVEGTEPPTAAAVTLVTVDVLNPPDGIPFMEEEQEEVSSAASRADGRPSAGLTRWVKPAVTPLRVKVSRRQRCVNRLVPSQGPLPQVAEQPAVVEGSVDTAEEGGGHH